MAEGSAIIAEDKPKRVLYFINEVVEDLLRRYIWTGCTNVELRDSIMSHATELIRQIIRKQGLHTIYPGQDESSFGDLLQTAWVQIEKTLYKFRARPHCRSCFNPDRPNDSALYTPGEFEYGILNFSDLAKRGIKSCPKCSTKFKEYPIVKAEQDTFGGSDTILYRGNSKVFNMWSQIARTVILAHIKKECRDRKNSSVYRDHVTNKLRHRGPEDAIITVHGPCRDGSLFNDSTDHLVRADNKDQKKIIQQNIAISLNDIIQRFLTEAREMCKYNKEYLQIIDALENLMHVDDDPANGMIGKLVDHSGLSRVTVTQFLRHIRLRSFEFSDSPISCAADSRRFDKHNAFPSSESEDE